MRKRHWLGCLLGGWLSLLGGQAMAQSFPDGQFGAGNPDSFGSLPPPYNANYGTYPQSYSGMPAGYPPDANAWPNVSPYYGPAVDQTVNQEGLWFNRILSGNRKFYFDAEGLYSITGRPSSHVGDPNANILPLTAPGAIYQDHNQQFLETASGTSTIGTPDRESAGNAGGGGGQGGDPQIFTPRGTGMLDTIQSGGLRGTWGWWNPDQTGFQLSGFWQAQGSSTLFVGDPRGFDPVVYNNIFAAAQTDYLTHLHAFAGIPLGGEDTDHDGLPGVVQPFDIFYQLQYFSQVTGANADWYAAQIYERPGVMVRPVYGARYMQVRERFSFSGADSGLGYDVSVGGGGGAQGTQGFLSPQTVQTTTLVNVMNSAVLSTVTSQLAGPEAGLRFDLGGDRLKIWTQSKFGLLANHASINLSGYNIGDAYYPKTTGTATDPTVMPRAQPGQPQIYNTFSHSEDKTILSPLFEQSIFAKANVFQFVPVLNKSKILNNAEFQVGYTAIFVANMYQPSNTIGWYAYNTTNPSFPNGPQIANNRSTFFTSNLSFGVEWQY